MIINSICGGGSKNLIPYPTLIGTSFTYNGSVQAPVIAGYSTDTVDVTGTTSATNAGTYTVTFTPKGDYYWIEDESQSAYSLTWTINKATGSLTLSTSSISYAGAVGGTTTFTFSYVGDGSISVSSSATSVCTVSRSGTAVTVTAVASGSSTITVSMAASTNYTGASGTCSATIMAARRIGGRIFYDNGSNGVTYKFFDSSFNEITDTSISGLANAYYYTASNSSPSTARWYVYDNTTHTQSIQGTSITVTNGLTPTAIYWGYFGTSTGATSHNIGGGKTNTTTVLNKGVPTDYTPNIWAYIKYCRDNKLNGCNDWFIASRIEQEKLRDSGLVNWYTATNYFMWFSTEDGKNLAYYWSANNGSYYVESKSASLMRIFACRSF